MAISTSHSFCNTSTENQLNPFHRDAAAARKALDHHHYQSLIEIYTCRKSSHVLLIHQAYHARYRTHLDLDIASVDPPHPFQKILLALSASHKAHHSDVSQHIANCDAKRLYETGEGKGGGGIDEAVVVEIFTKRSVAQLKLTFSAYTRIYGHTYTSVRTSLQNLIQLFSSVFSDFPLQFLKNADIGGIGDAVRSAAKCICNPPRYYAKVLYGWLKGKRSEEGAIVRVMEADMVEIEKELKKKYGVELKSMICESIQQGNHRDLLLPMAAR